MLHNGYSQLMHPMTISAASEVTVLGQVTMFLHYKYAGEFTQLDYLTCVMFLA